MKHVVYIDDEASGRLDDRIELHSFDDLTRNESKDPFISHVDPSDPAMIMFTSVSRNNEDIARCNY